MYRPLADRKADTNMLEVKKLLHCLLTNGYKFKKTREAVSEDADGIYTYPDDAIADFSKELKYSDADGNYIDDSIIKVSIHFEKRADYTNFEKNEDGDNVYGDPKKFIKGLVKEIKNSVENSNGKNSSNKRKTKKLKID
jgi:hypothetical protein